MNQHITKTAVIAAGGTGGHIFPGIATAQELSKRGWNVVWLGAENSMESRLVPENGFSIRYINFAGVRGKGLKRLFTAPFHLFKAVIETRTILKKIKPQVVLGFGGYIAMPAGLSAFLCRVPLMIHEQNAIAGLSNKLLKVFARRVYTAFPNVFPQGIYIGNPLRNDFLQIPPPEERFENRTGPLNILVMGGSQGAKALNETVPVALGRFSEKERPHVRHQSGAKQIDSLQATYSACQVSGNLVPFIDDVAGALQAADLVICRSGASTVCELACVGAPSILIPFPHAVDDHQTANAEFLACAGGAILCFQKDFSADFLHRQLDSLKREDLKKMAMAAYSKRKIDASEKIAVDCEEMLA